MNDTELGSETVNEGVWFELGDRYPNGYLVTVTDALGTTDYLGRPTKTILPDPADPAGDNDLNDPDRPKRETRYYEVGRIKSYAYSNRYGTQDAYDVNYTYDAEGNDKPVAMVQIPAPRGRGLVRLEPTLHWLTSVTSTAYPFRRRQIPVDSDDGNLSVFY